MKLVQPVRRGEEAEGLDEERTTPGGRRGVSGCGAATCAPSVTNPAAVVRLEELVVVVPGQAWCAAWLVVVVVAWLVSDVLQALW